MNQPPNNEPHPAPLPPNVVAGERLKFDAVDRGLLVDDRAGVQPEHEELSRASVVCSVFTLLLSIATFSMLNYKSVGFLDPMPAVYQCFAPLLGLAASIFALVALGCLVEFSEFQESATPSQIAVYWFNTICLIASFMLVVVAVFAT